MYSSPHQECHCLWHPECWHVRWHEGVQLTFELDIKLTMSVTKMLPGHIQGMRGGQGWDVWLVRAVSRACQLILISSLSLSLGPGYEDLQHYSHNHRHQRGSFPPSLDHARSIISRSVYLFAILLVGLFIVIMNVCDGENTSEYWLLASYPHSHFYWGL